MSNVLKSIEIIDDASTLEEFEKQIRSKGVSIYRVGDRVLYAVGDREEERESLNESLEENAFVLNLDYARAKLVYVDKSAGKTLDSKVLMERFASENEVDDVTEGIPVSLLPELIDFIGDNSALVEEEVSGSFEAAAEVVKQQEPADIPDDFDDGDDFVDDVDLTQKETAAFKEPADEPEEISEEHPESNNDAIPEKTEGIPEKRDTEPDVERNDAEKEYADFLMEKAVALFESQQHIRLPKFDELTHKELQEQVIDSQFAVSKARDKGINEIYNRLKNETTESIQTIKTGAIKSAREKHEEVLGRIERNYKYDVERILNEHNAEYEKDRENYIQSQIPVLRKQYDAKNSREYESVLTAEIEQLRKQSNDEMAEEREKFQVWVDGVLNDGKQLAINSIRVDDVIQKYNKVAEEQKDLLKLQAKKVRKEIGSTLTDVVNERDHLKEQLDQFQAKMEEQKQAEQERIESGVSVAFKEKEQELMKENKAKLDKAYDREQELLGQIEQLDSSLASEKENREALKREYIEPAKETAATEGDAGNREGNHQPVRSVYPEAKLSKFGKIKFIVGCGLSIMFIFLFAIGVFTLSDIKSEMARSNYIDQSGYIAQLEADERYDKAASKMKEFGYEKESIAEMYLDNGAYISALETDKAVLPEVYAYAEESSDPEEQKNILEAVKNSNVLDDNELNGLDLRIAILDEDEEAVNTLAFAENTDDATAKEAVRYYIDNQSFDEAEKLLKEHSDDKLNEELQTARESQLNEQADNLKKDIDTLNEKISENDKKGDDLKKDLDKIKKDKKAKDKKKKVKAKEKEIKKNSDQKEGLDKELEEKQNQLEELEK